MEGAMLNFGRRSYYGDSAEPADATDSPDHALDGAAEDTVRDRAPAPRGCLQ